MDIRIIPCQKKNPTASKYYGELIGATTSPEVKNTHCHCCEHSFNDNSTGRTALVDK